MIFLATSHGNFGQAESAVPRIVVYAIEGALASSISAPLEMLRGAEQFSRAARVLADPLSIEVASETGAALRMSGALSVSPSLAATAVDSADLAIVPSLWRSPGATVKRHPAIIASLKRLAGRHALLCSVGTGSYFLAQAGLLNGRPATTHWSYFEDFAQRYPRVRLMRQHLITRSGRFYCAGSVNSVADLMVHFIHGFFGVAAARQVEGQFSPEIRRPFQAHGFAHDQVDAHPDEAIWLAQEWMREHLAEPLRIPEVAARVGISTRNFSRRFRSAVDRTPAAFLQQLRIDAARDLLRQTNLAIGEVAARTGYPDPSHFSRVFRSQTGISPLEYRRRVRGKLFVASDAAAR